MPSIAFYTLVGHFSMFGELSGGEKIYLPPFPQDQRLLWREADMGMVWSVCARSARRKYKHYPEIEKCSSFSGMLRVYKLFLLWLRALHHKHQLTYHFEVCAIIIILFVFFFGGGAIIIMFTLLFLRIDTSKKNQIWRLTVFARSVSWNKNCLVLAILTRTFYSLHCPGTIAYQIMVGGIIGGWVKITCFPSFFMQDWGLWKEICIDVCARNSQLSSFSGVFNAEI